MTLHDVALDDKFDLGKERIFLSGAQAVIRMLLMQRERDRRAGLNTAGFVSGYRGSPLGGLDIQLWKAKKQLAQSEIVFQPGLNEELAATACWGTQQAELLGEGTHDGVFSVWYGKGPGVDRSGDVFRHANLAGSSKHGGVLALMGDDHMAESSTNAHATEFLFVDTMVPILNPAGVQEIIDYGLYGFAMSRFAGTWAAIKCVKDNIESTASVDASLERLNIVVPEFEMPPGGLNIRHEIDMLGQEERLHEYKRAAASAFIHANGLNRIVYSGGRKPKLGIITIGKSYLDVRQALEDIGIDEAAANRIGIRLFKVGCPWPIDLQHIAEFARGLDTIVVVEEKRSLIEVQLRENLYGTATQPVIVGKKDERGDWLFPAKGALDPNEIAIALGERILRTIGPSEEIAARVAKLRQFQAMLADTSDIASRTPFFCSGCPHNSSTKVPDGSLAAAGIGCHFMALWMDRNTVGFTAMGGEGAQWIGQAPFSKRDHIFQNLGDGTYNHSGALAIRFALSTDANITYKILYNDAVAMTGGQPHEGGLTVDMIARQVRAEGVERIAVVTDEPGKYAGKAEFPADVTIHHRDDLDLVQRELRDGQRHLRAALRPDLRRRKAPPPQARHLPRSRQARLHQRAGLRGLRRLRCAVELRLDPAGRDRVRSQAPDRPVELQQGFLLRQRLLSVLRHRAWCQDQEGRGHRRQVRSARRRAGAGRIPARRAKAGRRSSTASAAPGSSPSARCSAWRPISRTRAAA